MGNTVDSSHVCMYKKCSNLPLFYWNRSTHLAGHHAVTGFHGAGHGVAGSRSKRRSGGHPEARSRSKVLEVVAGGPGASDEGWARGSGPAERGSTRWGRAEGARAGAVVGRAGTVGRRREARVADILRGTRPRRGWARRSRRGGVLGGSGARRRAPLIRGCAGRRPRPRRRALKRRGPLKARRRPGERVAWVLREVLGLRAGRRSLPGRGGVLQGDWQRDGGRYAAAKACKSIRCLPHPVTPPASSRIQLGYVYQQQLLTYTKCILQNE